ncbi:hypothetical protein BWQ96_04067 [Gracilariopsis chorda]|uniref:Uncharacterized protein n=1 Tax=Gracilariopsis chorda TaxID=448386 RepID=A0A2V3IYI0_9FLOR|nr:hypothetical protein BWQ96_04067 [Gracilariopsis chorda]|eukprot:PXF46190.1 hypothetical protein BWQ96_04067 [Gracilariopsis chorda]
MPPKREDMESSSSNLSSVVRLDESDGDYKTPSTSLFGGQGEDGSDSEGRESGPLEISPVQQLLFDDIDIPSAIDSLKKRSKGEKVEKDAEVVYEREKRRPRRTNDRFESDSISNALGIIPIEEETAVEPHSEDFVQFSEDDESEEEAKSVRVIPGLQGLFSENDESSHEERTSRKSRTPKAPDSELEMFSPRLSNDELDRHERTSRGPLPRLPLIYEPKAKKTAKRTTTDPSAGPLPKLPQKVDPKANQKTRQTTTDPSAGRLPRRLQLPETKAEKTAKKTTTDSSARPLIRRPLGSRRKTLIDLSVKESVIEDSNGDEEKKSRHRAPRVQEEKVSEKSPESRSSATIESDIKVVSPPRKGVIMRANTHKTNVNGIRKAETGKIMSRDELLTEQKSMLLKENPIPKSLNPAAFSEEDDVMSRRPSTLFNFSSSESDGVTSGQRGKLGSQTDDGSFLEGGLLDKASASYTYHEVHSGSSSKFSENGSSSGIVNRLGSSFKKAKNAVARKSVTELPDVGGTDLLLAGTVDEAVLRICYVCRKKLKCKVFVKNTGRKIKVECDEDRKAGRYLRATLVLKAVGGDNSACAVNIRQSRHDGMKTTFARLWEFYQELEKGLQELG